ncbi:methyltransferase domain-containing protein [bacterium]|nr:MAG: methyltransferase domain-containing protein [bacterium]
MTDPKIYAKALAGGYVQPPIFRVKNTMLMNQLTEPLRKRLSDTLNAYLRGEDLTDSPYIKWGRETLREGRWFYGCINEADIQRRQQEVIELYHLFKEKGYDPEQSVIFDEKHSHVTYPIMVYFGEDGRINVCDGFHRLCIMSYLNIVTDVNAAISNSPLCLDTKRTGRTKGDFPLVETLIELNNGRNVYQPVADERVKDFNVWRKDSPNRLEYLLQHLIGKSVLDVGCCEGYFSIELAKRGFRVTAIDDCPKRVAVTNYLSTKSNLEIVYHVARWFKYLSESHTKFDNVLFLSVFHHDILNKGIDAAFTSLNAFAGRAQKLFFEVPMSSQKISWLNEDKKQLYTFTEREFVEKVEKLMGFTLLDTWHGIRPIFLFEVS